MRCSKHNLVSCPAEACGAPDETKPSEVTACSVCKSASCILTEEDCRKACDAFEQSLPDQQSLPDLSIDDFQRVMQGYLNSSACMSLFSVLIFLRASGENPRVVVKRRGHSLRVQLHRSNGEVQHFNRDGKP